MINVLKNLNSKEKKIFQSLDLASRTGNVLISIYYQLVSMCSHLANKPSSCCVYSFLSFYLVKVGSTIPWPVPLDLSSREAERDRFWCSSDFLFLFSTELQHLKWSYTPQLTPSRTFFTDMLKALSLRSFYSLSNLLFINKPSQQVLTAKPQKKDYEVQRNA